MQLRPYQLTLSQQAADIVRQHGCVLLAMEVRTGKTVTALNVAKLLGAAQVLFVTKKKAIGSIESDCAAMQMCNVTVTNYDQLHKYEPLYDLVIVDECHSIGAFPLPSQRAKELRRLCAHGVYVVYLSGTPTPESYSQFYHQFWITDASPWVAYTNFYRWAKEYVNITKKYLYNREINDYTAANRDKVMADIQHLILTYTQEQAGFTEMVQERILTVPLSPAAQVALKILKRDKVLTMPSGRTVLADTAVKLMSKTHQICSGTVLPEEGPPAVIFDITKATTIRDKFAGQKIAVFYKFIAEGEALRRVFGNRIVTDPQAFNAAGPNAVFISQIQSGREGINLSTADALVMYNIDFSALSYWQARARMQSKDRTRPAVVWWVFTEGGIEEKIYRVVQEKKDYTLSHFKRY